MKYIIIYQGDGNFADALKEAAKKGFEPVEILPSIKTFYIDVKFQTTPKTIDELKTLYGKDYIVTEDKTKATRKKFK